MVAKDPFRLRWGRSWPPKDADYTGSYAGAPKKLAHIYRDRNTVGDRAWRWTVFDDKRLIGSGYAPDAQGAARAAENAYFAEEIAEAQ